MLLAGDIGGTKTILALYEEGSAATSPFSETTYPSRRYESLGAVIREFLHSLQSEKHRARRAVFGVAGPVVTGRATLPNLPWVIEEPAWLAEELERAPDQNAIIFEKATQRKPDCRICTLTVQTFVSILAAETGNVVLRHMATGGLYLGGGIPPRILPWLRQGNFEKWFVRKGRLSHLSERTPVQVIMHPKTALLGSASLGLLQEQDR